MLSALFCTNNRNAYNLTPAHVPQSKVIIDAKSTKRRRSGAKRKIQKFARLGLNCFDGRPLFLLYFRDLFAYDDRVILADLVLGVFLVVELAVVHVGVAVRAAEETAASTAEPCGKQEGRLDAIDGNAGALKVNDFQDLIL